MNRKVAAEAPAHRKPPKIFLEGVNVHSGSLYGLYMTALFRHTVDDINPALPIIRNIP